MITKDIPIDYTITYPLEKKVDVSSVLFLDIETTGFSAKSSYLYLIGGIYYKDKQWNLIQWFAEDKKEEKTLLETFGLFCRSFQTAIHYNGNGFDIPYLTYKFTRHNIDNPLEKMDQMDLYKAVLPLKKILKLINLKQKSLEHFMHINREDQFDGGQLIVLYDEYCDTADKRLEQVLLLHNHDDMIGMIKLLPLLSYQDLFQGDFHIVSCISKEQENYQGEFETDIIFELSLSSPILQPVSCGKENIYFVAKGFKAFVKVRLFKGTLKYFYNNYKDYYYLPAEDTAIHRSVASYVDKEYRQKAKAATCYMKKNAHFLPQYDKLISPYFKLEYRDKYFYFEYNQDFILDPQSQYIYIKHLLKQLTKLQT